MAVTGHSSADDVPRKLVARVHAYPEGNGQGAHAHRRGQLAGADRGAIRVRVPGRTWVVPCTWAIWIPSWVEHDIQATESLNLFSIYVEPEDARALPAGPCVVSMPALLREMIARVMSFPSHYDETGKEGRLAAALLDQLDEIAVAPLDAPVPSSEPLAEIYARLCASPGDPTTLEQWAAYYGVSARSLNRRCHRETGMGFRRWRTQIKLMQALVLLSRGTSPTHTADALGYESASAFNATFKKYLGCSPTRYFESCG